MARFSRLGEHGLGWHAPAGACSLFDRERRPLYLRAVRAVGLAFVTNLHDLPPLTGPVSRLSYPWAHAATSFAAARSLPLPRAVLHPIAAAIALSRLYLGVHYRTVTVAGAAPRNAVARLVP